MITVYLFAAVTLANLPWMGQKAFLILGQSPKRGSVYVLEWVVYCMVFIGLGIGLENKTNGVIHDQDWEFYAVMVLVFMVFSIPGVIYHRHIKHSPAVATR